MVSACESGWLVFPQFAAPLPSCAIFAAARGCQLLASVVNSSVLRAGGHIVCVG